ncbi:helix-turn-helix domain-containing protein [Streptomyces sp. NPDC015171]|uniref:helix-turn-helix domain-containing protein n=2 Tax=Streptomyces TaxID=1883 RepID=UPI0036FF5D4D
MWSHCPDRAGRPSSWIAGSAAGSIRRLGHPTTVSEDSRMPARLLSIPAVAAALDVDRRTVYRFIAAGDLPVVDLRTGTERSRVRVPAAGLEEFIARRLVVSPRPRR